MVSYANRGVPDWYGQLLALRETLNEVIFLLEEDEKAGVRADISCLNAFDTLNQFLESIKQDLGCL